MGIFDVVFPKKCLGCGESGGYFCVGCMGRVRKAKERCPMCNGYSYGGKTHESCQTKWGLEGLINVFDYEGVVRKAILKLKYNFVSELADELGRMMVNELKKTQFLEGAGAVLVPVPLGRSRKRWRGFNQAAEVGKVVAREMCWNYAEIIERRVETVSQTKLDYKKRRENVEGVFCVKTNSFNVSELSTAAGRPRHARAITKDSSIVNSSLIYIVFDDVWTTGATMKECAKVLKRNGVGEVWGLTLAS